MDIADEQSKDPSRVQSRDQSLLHDHDQDHDRDHEGGVSAKPDEPPPLTLLSPPAKPEGPTDWQRLNTLYASLPGCKSLQSPTKGLGKNLQRMLDVHGLQDAEIMLQWMAYATGCAKADSLSESGHRVLSTVGRAEHVEGYWPHVHRWAALGKKGLPDGRPKRKRFMNGHRPTEVEGYDPYNPGKTR